MDNGALPTVYALDFGTSNSLLAAANEDRVWPPLPIDPRASDPTILRSVLYFPNAQRCYYGEEALRRYAENGLEGRLLRSIKKHLPSRSFNGTFIDERPMLIEDLIAAILREMRVRADTWFGTEVDIYFDEANTLRPDVAGWRRDRVPERPTGMPVRVRPDWVCEILSTNRANDLVRKKRIYRELVRTLLLHPRSPACVPRPRHAGILRRW